MMADTNINLPPALAAIEADTRALGFTRASDRLTGALLRALAASKPAGALLELGTGTGVGTAWIVDGMDAQSKLITVDSNAQVSAIAQQHLGSDLRVTFHVQDGATLLQSLVRQGSTFDFIFADSWPGKYTHLDEALQLLKPGGLYIVDDMLPVPMWPADHLPKVANLIATLQQRPDLNLVQLDWATGIIVAVKISPPRK